MKPVYVVSVLQDDKGACVTISGKGGAEETWLFGPAQMRIMAIAFSAALPQVSTPELVKEIADLMRVDPPCDTEVPFSA